jgi:hypothetical protein
LRLSEQSEKLVTLANDPTAIVDRHPTSPIVPADRSLRVVEKPRPAKSVLGLDPAEDFVLAIPDGRPHCPFPVVEADASRRMR